MKLKTASKLLKLFYISLIIFFQIKAIASEVAVELKVGKTEFNELNSTDTHVYSLKLTKDQFVAGDAMQIGVDLIVSIFDPEGEIVNSFDGSC